MASSTKRRPASQTSRAGPKSSHSAPAPSHRRPRRPGTLRRALRNHPDEVLGAGLLVAGVLSALGLWLGLLGPAGSALSFVGGLLFRLGRPPLPVALVVLGAGVLAARRPVPPAGPRPLAPPPVSPSPARLGAGLALAG